MHLALPAHGTEPPPAAGSDPNTSAMGSRGAESRWQHGGQVKIPLPDPVVAELALLGLVHVNGAGGRLVQIRRGRGSGHLIIRLLVARGGTHGSCGESGAGQRGVEARSPHPIPFHSPPAIPSASHPARSPAAAPGAAAPQGRATGGGSSALLAAYLGGCC